MSEMGYGDAFRQCLLDVDVVTMRKLWAYVAPHMPQPDTDGDIEISIHHARTLTKSINFRARAYSHAWLNERSLPSGLPDDLRPRAERMFPHIVSGVGLSINFHSNELRPLGLIIRGAMENAVMEVYADGKLDDSLLVRRRMEEARKRVFKELMLPLRKP